jgi:hypothetical protein
MDSYPVKSYNFNQQIGFNILFGLKTTEHRNCFGECFRRSIDVVPITRRYLVVQRPEKERRKKG